MVMVAASAHSLAAQPGPIPSRVLAQHVQLVLTDRSELSRGREFGVLAARTWRLADLGAKHAFLRAGLGWGGMPRHMVEEDLAEGRLVALALEDAPAPRFFMPMLATYPAAKPPGPAGRWMIERLKGAH
jgi:DNA-binding transcriptional LysR family regulator